LWREIRELKTTDGIPSAGRGPKARREPLFIFFFSKEHGGDVASVQDHTPSVRAAGNILLERAKNRAIIARSIFLVQLPMSQIQWIERSLGHEFPSAEFNLFILRKKTLAKRLQLAM